MKTELSTDARFINKEEAGMQSSCGNVRLLGLFFGFVISLAGCAGKQPISSYARTGDTVLISLGGSDANALVPLLHKENIAIRITDAVNVTYPVLLRHLFRVYSDPTSGYDYRSPNINYPPYVGNLDSYVDPYQGMWMAVVDLVDPQTNAPPPLVVGSAHLSVSSSEIQNWVDFSGFNGPWTNGNLDNIPLNILPGTGSKNPLNYLTPMSTAPVASLEPLAQLDVTVSGTPSAPVGGGSFTIQYLDSSFPAYSPPKVVTTTPDPNVQLAVERVPQGDGTTRLHVMLTNPHGFEVDNDRTGLFDGKSMLRSLQFNIVWDWNSDVSDENWQDSFQMVNAEYFDMEGYVMPDIVPVMQMR